MISKFDVGLKSLLHQGLSEPEFYGDLVYKFKNIRGMTDFSDQFRKIIMHYKRIGYNLNVMRQSTCLVINPITVDPEFYGDLVYKFKNIRGMTDFSDQFRKIIMHYKRIGYNLNVMRQSTC